MDDPTRGLTEALGLMKSALSLIDDADVAHEVGAHLDHAVALLADYLQSGLDSDDERVRRARSV